MKPRYKLIELTPDEASSLTFIVQHKKSKNSLELLENLNGSAYEIGKILIYGRTQSSDPYYLRAARAYENWRKENINWAQSHPSSRRKMRQDLRKDKLSSKV
ncbi:Uncharacterised protein [uncultured archaeon]|nr:Uncharacterised protein [uncultured archaeon]